MCGGRVFRGEVPFETAAQVGYINYRVCRPEPGRFGYGTANPVGERRGVGEYSTPPLSVLMGLDQADVLGNEWKLLFLLDETPIESAMKPKKHLVETFMKRNVFTLYLITSVLLMGLLALKPAYSATVWFTSPELRVAAEDLGFFIEENWGDRPGVELATVDQSFRESDWVLANAVKNRHPSVQEVLTPRDGAYLESNGPESYIAFNSGGVRYLVGGGHRGTVYASVRTQRASLSSATPPLSIDGEMVRGVPAFKERLAGAGGPHPEDDYSQPKPTDYSWETYARDLSDHGINLTPGVIHGETVPDGALEQLKV